MNTTIRDLDPLAHVKIVSLALLLGALAISVSILARPVPDNGTAVQRAVQTQMSALHVDAGVNTRGAAGS